MENFVIEGFTNATSEIRIGSRTGYIIVNTGIGSIGPAAVFIMKCRNELAHMAITINVPE
jgi:hypothetical protein